MELVEFLLQRIAEDEAVAREVVARASVYAAREVSWRWLRVVGDSSMWEPTTHTPARVLAECEAKRRIVGYCSSNDDFEQGLLQYFADPKVDAALVAQIEPFAQLFGHAMNDALADVLKYLALPYADHPDYRQEWRP